MVCRGDGLLDALKDTGPKGSDVRQDVRLHTTAL